MAWTVAVDDTFARADTTPGAAGSTTGVGNGWTDTIGGNWSIASDQLNGNSTDPNAFLSGVLRRPASEAAGDQRIVVSFPGAFSGAIGPGLRCQNSNTYYLANVVDVPYQGKQIFLYAVVSGAISTVASDSMPAPLNTAHSFTLDFSVTGLNPSTYSVVATDTTTGTVVGSLSGTDGTAALQAAGSPCIAVWQNGASNPAAKYAEVTTYTASAGSTPTPTPTPPSLGPLSIGCIGDSITAGTNGNPTGAMASYLTELGYSVTLTNRGINSMTTADWLPSGGIFAPAVAAFQAAGVTIVQVMLGTNDVRTPNSFTPAQHAANMRAIVAGLRSAGFKVVLHKPLWTVPNSTAASGADVWPADPNATYCQYFATDAGLADGVSVFIGDTGNFQQTALSPSTLLASDGIHPANAAANTAIGQFWAVALLNRYAPASARWTHS